MKGSFYVLVFLLISANIIAQDYELPSWKHYSVSDCYWSDSIPENQKEYWLNGNLKIEYENLNDRKKIRKEYFENGEIKLTAEVEQMYVIDSIYLFDPITFEESIKIRSGYRDIFAGEYIEYANHEGLNFGQIITKGQYVNHKMSGDWWTIKEHGIRIAVTLNSKEELDGWYTEYYLGQSEHIKIRGIYKPFQVVRHQINLHGGRFSVIRQVKSRRIGEWNYYGLDGKVLETVIYKRPND